MAAPTGYPDYATDTNYTNGPDVGTPTKIEPSAGELAEGNIGETFPSAQKFNWWQNLVGLWIRHFAANVRSDVQVFTTVGAGTWTKPSWATSVTPVRAIVVNGGGGGASSGLSTTTGGGGAGSVPVVGEYFAGTLSATESLFVGNGGSPGTSGSDGSSGGTSTFASGKDYATTSAVSGGGKLSGSPAGAGGNGGNGGGAGGTGGTGNGGTGGSGGGRGFSTSSGSTGTYGTGMLGESTGGFVGACFKPGAGGTPEQGGRGGVGWGAGGGGAAAVDAGVTGGGGGGSGWLGFPGYPTAGNGANRGVTDRPGGHGVQGIIIVITGMVPNLTVPS